MYSMVVMLALSQSPALDQVRPDQDRYGNQLQADHNRLLGGRRNRGCGGCNSGCGYGGGYAYGGCNTCSTGCSTGSCGAGGCATGGCATGSCGTGGCATASCGTSNCGVSCNSCYGGSYGGGRRGLFSRRGGRGGRGNNCCPQVCCVDGSQPMYVSGGQPMAVASGPMMGNRMAFYGANGEAPATLIVQLPADAQLTVDGQPTQSTGPTRVLQSPPLQPGKEFTYELKARNSAGQEETRQVKVSAGQRVDVALNSLQGQQQQQPASTEAPKPQQ